MLPKAALVISLKRNELGRMKTFKARWKFSNIPLTVIEGIDGLQLEYPSTFSGGKGTYGCLLSHIKAITFAKENKFDDVLIMEDDIRFLQDFEFHLSEAMKQLPEHWDCLWLGGYDEVKGTKYSERLLTNISSWGGYGYILRNTVYDFFINKLSELTLPCDNHFMKYQKDFNSFKTSKPYILHSHISSVRMNADKGIAV